MDANCTKQHIVQIGQQLVIKTEQDIVLAERHQVDSDGCSSQMTTQLLKEALLSHHFGQQILLCHNQRT